MFASLQPYRKNHRGIASTLLSGVLVIGFGLAAPPAMGSTRDLLFEGKLGAPAAGAGAAGGAEAGGGASGGAHPVLNQPDVTTCPPGQVWSAKRHRCLQRHAGVLPDPELTEYALALAKADRYQEAIDVLDLLDNPDTPRALNYRGYATRKLGRTDEGIGYYLKAVALDPNYPQVREYLGEAYVIKGKFDLAKDQLATIEKLCGKDCVYYTELTEALEQAHAL